MPGLFAKVFRGKDGAGASKSKRNASQLDIDTTPAQPTRWEDAWTRKSVDPSEVQELLRGCTTEIKSRGAYATRKNSDLPCPRQDGSGRKIHWLTFFSPNSSRYPLPPSPFPPHLGPKCCANIRSEFLQLVIR